MHDFTPKPYFSTETWRDTISPQHSGGTKTSAGLDEFVKYIDTFSQATYFSWGLFVTERGAPPGGYVHPFPTSTDCLLWVRWCLCGTLDEPDDEPNVDEQTREAVQTARETIDNAPAGTDSARLLRDLAYLLYQDFDGWSLEGLESIHKYLTDHGTVEEWRSFLADDTINEVNGHWSMTPAGWKNLHERFASDGFTGVSPPELDQ